MNRLYFGDNLAWLRHRHEFPAASVDLVYLDPPFNSNADYNVLFREPSGQVSKAPFHAFTDTWSWADGVILEERLRSIGGIGGESVGRDLVNKVFGKNGVLAEQFDSESEREGYRDLFAGIVGAFRNPSGHRLVDPNPHEGGAYILFVNLLLSHLERLKAGRHTKPNTDKSVG